MAKKISGFDKLTDLSGDDYLPIIDYSEIQANMNKRVTVSTLDSRYILSNVTEDTSSVTISGDIVPSTNNTYSIGLENKQYSNLFVNDVSISNKLDINGDVSVTGNTTLNGNPTLNGDTTLNGNVTIPSGGDVDFLGNGGGIEGCSQISATDVSVSNNLQVSGDTSLGNLTAGGSNYNTNFGDNIINIGHQQINLNYTNTDINGSIDLGSIIVTGLPTNDPESLGKLWNDNGTLKISNGSVVA